MITGIRNVLATKPLPASSAIPVAGPTSSASHGFIPWDISSAQTSALNPKIEPTDRSISVIAIKNTIP